MKLRKITAVLAAALLTMTAMTACSGGAASSASSETPSSESSAASAESASSESTSSESAYSEETTGGDMTGEITVLSREDGSGTRGAFIELPVPKILKLIVFFPFRPKKFRQRRKGNIITLLK